MLIPYRFSIVGLHVLLLTHIAHSFVLLTANVEDVKKIARKFVSDSLAEKIADFITRATATMAENEKISEENVSNADAQDSSQVSVENRMYNIERHGGDSQATEGEKEEIVLGKVTVKIPEKTTEEKKRHRFEEPSTTRKHRKEPKPLHGRSRYVVQSKNKASLATEKALSKISEEEKYNKVQESIKLLERKLFSNPDGKPKNKKQKRHMKSRAHKLLSGFASVENEAAKGGIPNDEGTKDDEISYNVRAHDEKVLSLLTEEAATGIEQHDIKDEKQTEKGATDDAQHEIKDDKITEIVATNKTIDLETGRDEFDHNENNIIEKTDKRSSGSRSFVDGKEVDWWEKELQAQNHEVNKGKSWF